MTTVSSVLMRLRAEASRASLLAPGTEWFLFGSVLHDAEAPADIDVLIVCPTDDSVMVVRRELTELCVALPLHLLVVNQAEERELDLVAKQRGQRFFPEQEPTSASDT